MMRMYLATIPFLVMYMNVSNIANLLIFIKTSKGRDEREESSEEGVACELSEGQKTTPKVDRSKKPVKGKKLGN